LWRSVLGGDAFYIQKNTAVAGDFSTAIDCLKFASSGAAIFSSTGAFNNATLNGAYLVVKGANGVPASSGTTTTAVFRVSSGTGLYNVLDFGTNESLDYSWIQSTRANSLGTYDYLAIQPNGGNLLVGTLSNSSYKLDVNGNGRFTSGLTAASFSTGGNIEVTTTSAGYYIYNSKPALRYSYFGYSSSYHGILVGATTGNQSLFFNVDITGNPSGAFSGGGSEYVWRNTGSFITPNASNNGYNTLFSWNSSGQVTINNLSVSGFTIGSNLQLGDYTGSTSLTFASSNNGIAKINFYDGNNTEGLYLRTDGEAYGGTMTFGARWDDDEAKIVFKMYQVSAGGSYHARVGIGTTAPLKILHIAEGGNNNGILWTDDAAGNYRNEINNTYSGAAAASNTMVFKVSNATTTGQVTALTLNGAGAGTFGGGLTIGSTMNINGNGAININSQNGFQVGADAFSGGFYVYDNTASVYRFKITNAGLANFSGNVYAVGSFVASSSTTAEIRLQGGSYGSSYNTSLRSIAGAIGILQFGNNGENYILAGNTLAGGYLSIRVNCASESITAGTEAVRFLASGGTNFYGTITSTSDIIAYYSSDKRLKDNIKNIENSIDKIKKLNGISFNWNDKQDIYEIGKKDYGVIAQDVENILPELVETRSNGYKAVKYEKLISLLIEGIKEQQVQIDELKKQII
jgi:hypothetical protein